MRNKPAGGTAAASSLRRRIFVLGTITAILGIFSIWFFLCRRWTEDAFLAASRRIEVGQTRDEVDRILRFACECLVDQPTWRRYRCRPTGEGICSCAPTMVLMIDLSYSPSDESEVQRVTRMRQWDVGGLSQARQSSIGASNGAAR